MTDEERAKRIADLETRRKFCLAQAQRARCVTNKRDLENWAARLAVEIAKLREETHG